MKNTNIITLPKIVPFENLTKLIEVVGVSGHENLVRQLIEKEIQDFAQFYLDSIGSLIAKLNCKVANPCIAITAHMDEIGFEIQQITNEGILVLKPLGVWWAPVPYGQQILIDTGEQIISGVTVTPSPWTLNEEKGDLPSKLNYIQADIGCRNVKEI